MRYSTFAFVTLFVAAAAPALAVPVDLWTRFDELEPRHNLPGQGDLGPPVRGPPGPPPAHIWVPPAPAPTRPPRHTARPGPPHPKPTPHSARPGGHARRGYHDEGLAARMEDGLYDELFSRAWDAEWLD